MVTIDVMPPCVRPGFIDHFIYNLQNIFSSAQLCSSRETILQFTPQPSLTSKQWEVSIKYKVVCQHDVISSLGLQHSQHSSHDSHNSLLLSPVIWYNLRLWHNNVMTSQHDSSTCSHQALSSEQPWSSLCGRVLHAEVTLLEHNHQELGVRCNQDLMRIASNPWPIRD